MVEIWIVGSFEVECSNTIKKEITTVNSMNNFLPHTLIDTIHVSYIQNHWSLFWNE